MMEPIYLTLGHFDEAINFSFGDKTDADGACGVTFKNEFWLFGGANKQVNEYIRNF